MQKKKINRKNKGITLIALVITIIVMLILVGVTISVSLNGGLFSTAKKATEETQIAQESEQLLVAAMGTLGQDGKVDLGKLDNNLPEGFEKTGEGIYKSTKTEHTFIVNENGEIELYEEKEKIEFTICGTKMYAEEGMTWDEWCDSSYNLPYEGTEDTPISCRIVNGRVCSSVGALPLVDGSNNFLLAEDKIINGANLVYYVYTD